MHHGITLKAILVPVVINVALQRLCINTEVSHTERLENETKCFKVIYKVGWSHT